MWGHQQINDMWDRYAGGAADLNSPVRMCCGIRPSGKAGTGRRVAFPDTTGVGMWIRDDEMALSNVFGRGFDARVHGMSPSG